VIWKTLKKHPIQTVLALALALGIGRVVAGSYNNFNACITGTEALLLSVFYVVGTRAVLFVLFFTGVALARCEYARYRQYRAACAAKRQEEFSMALAARSTEALTCDLDLSYLHHNWLSFFLSNLFLESWNTLRCVALVALTYGLMFWVLGAGAIYLGLLNANTWAAAYLCATDLKAQVLVLLFAALVASCFWAIALYVAKLEIATRLFEITDAGDKPQVLEYLPTKCYSLALLNGALYRYDRNCRNGNTLSDLLELQCRPMPMSDAEMYNLEGMERFFRWELRSIYGDVVYAIHIRGRVYVKELDHEIKSLMPTIASSIRERIQAQANKNVTKGL
jgi:hypothetical protein